MFSCEKSGVKGGKNSSCGIFYDGIKVVISCKVSKGLGWFIIRLNEEVVRGRVCKTDAV